MSFTCGKQWRVYVHVYMLYYIVTRLYDENEIQLSNQQFIEQYLHD